MKTLGLDRWWIIPSNPKAILGRTSQNRSLQSSLVIFEGRILGMNATTHQIRICNLMEEPWKASHHFTNCSNRFQGSAHRDYPSFWVLSLSFCKLVFFTIFSKTDPYFQDLKLIVRGYKAKDICSSKGGSTWNTMMLPL